MCVDGSHPLHLVGDCDLQQGGEVGQPGTKAVPQHGELGQENMNCPFLSGNRQQLPVICPVHLIQTCRRRSEDHGDAFKTILQNNSK